MFAPKVAKAQTKATASSTSKLTPQRSILAARRFGGSAVEQTLMLQRSIGNQATPRLLAQRATNRTEGEPHGHNEQETDPASPTAAAATPRVSWDFSDIPLLPRDQSNGPRALTSITPSSRPAAIQTKLEVGRVDDPLEHEAERTADQVMGMQDPHTSMSKVAAQLGRTGTRLPEKGQTPPPRPNHVAVASADLPASVPAVLNSPGQSLEPATRAYFEPRFGHEFSGVRMHADPPAAASALAVGALAYTVGQDIVFAEGQYRPDTTAGKHLLAHELAHVTQTDRQAPAQTSSLRRFASYEHKDLGTEASGGARSDINIGTDAAPEYLTFGEVVALSGDYFGSLEEMRLLAQTPEGRQKLRWTRWYALDQSAPEPALAPAEKQAVKDHYYDLAAKNVSHFSAGGTADNTYQGQHTKALELAFQAGAVAAQTAAASGVTHFDLQPAQTQEAFAQHFLSDMFSGGHVRTERTAIKAWYGTNMPNATEQLIAYMAHHIRTYIADHLTSQYSTSELLAAFLGHVPNISWLGKLRLPSEPEIGQTIRALGGKALDAFGLGDIVSLAWHNADSQGIAVVSEADEAGVKVPGGYKWQDVGDKMLGSSSATRAMVLAAMRASLAELQTAAQMGSQQGAGAQSKPMFQQAVAAMQPFAAERYVPHANPSGGNPDMVWQWQFLNKPMYDAVDTAVKTEVADQISTLAAQQDGPKRDALNDFASLLQIIGIHALELAVGQDARIKPAPHYGLYGESPTPAGP